jgi:hypothetical protein
MAGFVVFLAARVRWAISVGDLRAPAASACANEVSAATIEAPRARQVWPPNRRGANAVSNTTTGRLGEGPAGVLDRHTASGVSSEAPRPRRFLVRTLDKEC